MARVIVNLTDAEFHELNEQAQRRSRGMRDQARHLIVTGLRCDQAEQPTAAQPARFDPCKVARMLDGQR